MYVWRSGRLAKSSLIGTGQGCRRGGQIGLLTRRLAPSGQRTKAKGGGGGVASEVDGDGQGETEQLRGGGAGGGGVSRGRKPERDAVEQRPNPAELSEWPD